MSLILPTNGRFQEPFPPCRFLFEADNRERYPVRPERRGKRVYWYMRKVVDGRLHNIYVAPEGLLTRELLDNAAKHIDGQTEVTQ